MLVRKLQDSGKNVRGCPQSRATKGTVLWFQLSRQVGMETTPRDPAGTGDVIRQPEVGLGWLLSREAEQLRMCSQAPPCFWLGDAL